MNEFVQDTSSTPSPTIYILNQWDRRHLRRLQTDGCNYIKLRRSSGGIDNECCNLVHDSGHIRSRWETTSYPRESSNFCQIIRCHMHENSLMRRAALCRENQYVCMYVCIIRYSLSNIAAEPNRLTPASFFELPQTGPPTSSPHNALT